MPRCFQVSKATGLEERVEWKDASKFTETRTVNRGEMKAMDAIGVLVAQHRTIDGLFEEMRHEPRRRRLTNLVSRLAEELIAHLAAEEAVFYPAMRRVLDDGPETSDRGRNEHSLLRIELRRVLEASVTDPSFGERLASLHQLFELHACHEEGELFPRFAQAASPSQLQMLGDEIVASRPPVWIVTTEGRSLVQSNSEWSLRSRLSLELGAASTPPRPR
jgi:hemerythrin superfamily protein